MKYAPYLLRLRLVNVCAKAPVPIGDVIIKKHLMPDVYCTLTPELVTRHVACHMALTVSQEIRSMQIFSTLRELRFGDCDISGTAYFPAYLDILNGVNEEFWAHLGYPWHNVIAKERWGTPTVHLSCDFSKPSFFGETLKFVLIVTRVGRASLTLRHKISVADQTRWTCTQVLASSDLDSHTAKPWDDTVKSLLETWQIDTDELPF